MAENDENEEMRGGGFFCGRQKEPWLVTGTDARDRESSGTVPDDGCCTEYKENDPGHENKKADSDGAVGFFQNSIHIHG